MAAATAALAWRTFSPSIDPEQSIRRASASGRRPGAVPVQATLRTAWTSSPPRGRNGFWATWAVNAIAMGDSRGPDDRRP